MITDIFIGVCTRAAGAAANLEVVLRFRCSDPEVRSSKLNMQLI